MIRKKGILFTLSTDDQLPDSFFEVTVDDIRVMLRDLKNERYHSNAKCF